MLLVVVVMIMIVVMVMMIMLVVVFMIMMVVVVMMFVAVLLTGARLFPYFLILLFHVLLPLPYLYFLRNTAFVRPLR
jgi:hypothetical protein